MNSSGNTKTLTILGSTGSIGRQTLEVVEAFPDTFSLNYLTTNKSVALLEEQALRYAPRGVVIADEAAYLEFKSNTSFKGIILGGTDGLCEAAACHDNTMVMSSLVGFSGVLPTLAATRQGTTIALANKETLVSAGEYMMAEAARHGAEIIAVDSEHSALLQCLVGEKKSSIEKLIITASGGPFRTLKQQELESVTAAQALKHPNWSMGNKITIDSSTLMNKGFEVIEARWLFDIPASAIEVVVHPQSIIHSLVQFSDGSVKAQLGLPDMKVPIVYALSYPGRFVTDFERMNLAEIATLTFEKPDTHRFPCLRLAFDALEAGGLATTALNAANEMAVAAFLAGKIAFLDIPRIIENAVTNADTSPQPTIDEIIVCDADVRRKISLDISQ